MASKSELKKGDEEFKFTLQHVIRIGIFLVLIVALINYFSTNKQPSSNDPTVLGEEVDSSAPSVNLKQLFDRAYQSLPPESKEIISNLNRNPAIINSQQIINNLRQQFDGFPGKQIKQIQKDMLTRMYQNALDSLENK